MAAVLMLLLTSVKNISIKKLPDVAVQFPTYAAESRDLAAQVKVQYTGHA